MYRVGLTSETNHFFGKKHTDKTLAKLQVAKPKYQCQHCNSVVGVKSNYERWHSNNCKVLKGALFCQD